MAAVRDPIRADRRVVHRIRETQRDKPGEIRGAACLERPAGRARGEVRRQRLVGGGEVASTRGVYRFVDARPPSGAQHPRQSIAAPGFAPHVRAHAVDRVARVTRGAEAKLGGVHRRQPAGGGGQFHAGRGSGTIAG